MTVTSWQAAREDTVPDIGIVTVGWGVTGLVIGDADGVSTGVDGPAGLGVSCETRLVGTVLVVSGEASNVIVG